jgi:ABC-type microcin C transport system duplicated ATPase subunit YejF
MAMVFMTHNLALVCSVAQRVAVLCQGRVMASGDTQSGDTDTVPDRPGDPYPACLLTNVPKVLLA